MGEEDGKVHCFYAADMSHQIEGAWAQLVPHQVQKAWGKNLSQEVHHAPVLAKASEMACQNASQAHLTRYTVQ